MNHYTFSEMEVGLKASFTATVTEEDMARFCAVTGDISPIHTNTEYAKSRGFAGRVVYGMLSAAYFSTLAGVYLPGEHCLLHSVNTSFKNPVFIGDTLTVHGEVAERSEAFGRVTLKGKIANQNGKTVCKAEITLGVAK